jgi:hypothetical protein
MRPEPLRKGRPAESSGGEIMKPGDLVAEAERVSGKVRDHLGVMGEYGESEVIADTGPEEIPIEVDVADIEPIRPPREKPPAAEPAAVDLVLGGEVERTGSTSFRIPLTFRIHDIEKDIVLNISVQISDSDKDRDIF